MLSGVVLERSQDILLETGQELHVNVGEFVCGGKLRNLLILLGDY